MSNRVAAYAHGRSGYVNHACRCRVCRDGNSTYFRQKRRADPAAWAAYQREWRRRRVSALAEGTTAYEVDEP